MSVPVVSIIIPSFNTSTYLKMMLECVLHQSFENWELLVVDDGSTDESVQIVESYLNNDSRIKLIQRKRKPKGGQTCKNIGYQEAIGKYIVFFDSDDLISPNCLEQRVNFMIDHPSIDFGIFPLYFFSGTDDKPSYSSNSRILGKPTGEDVITSFLTSRYQFVVCTNIYKRLSLSSIHWDERVLVRQDLDFNLSCIFNGLQYAFSTESEFDYFYRSGHSSNTVCSTFVTPAKCSSTIYLFEKIIVKLKEHHFDKKYIRQLKHYIVIHYERIVFDTSGECLDEFLEFCSKYYSSFFVFKLKIISDVVLKVKSKDNKKKIGYLLLLFLFCYKRHFKVVINNIFR